MEPITDVPLVRIERPVMRMDWRVLTYLHWPVAPEAVAAHLPEGLEPDLHDGKAWVGLIPFDMRDIRPPGVPRGIPWIGSFPETNVRTYVVGRDGGRGVWFHSLDITRSAAVAVARLGYALPYHWGSMSIAREGQRLTYIANRRWEGRARSLIEVEVGARLHEPTELDRFLANRWLLYASGPSGLVRARVDHEPWPLHEASVARLDDELVAAAGYEVQGPPVHVRFSPGVAVGVGLPERVG